MFSIFGSVESSDKTKAVEKMIENSTPRTDFFLFVVLSTAMAALGIMISSVPVIIGSMLIAPMLYPILSIGMGLSISDNKLLRRSFYTFLKSVLYAIGASVLVSIFFVDRQSLINLDIIIRTEVALIDLGIAVIAGVAASLALVKPHLNESIPGVAISAALVPPLAVVGIAMTTFNWELFRETLLLFVVSSFGIVVSSLIVFVMLNFSTKKTVIEKVIKEEDKEIEKEVENNEG